MGAELTTGFDCSVCGQHHDILPLSFSVKAPDAAIAIAAAELEQRVLITADQCVIDGRDFYLRGRIPVPIHGLEEPFIWGVWAEVSPQNFTRTNEMWRTEGRENDPPFDGWLASELFPYDNTLNLKLRVQTQPVGRRPHYTVLEQEHALAREQREGISMERVIQIAEMILHVGELSLTTRE